ncbi:hypothetical protein [Maribacter sp. 2308TA10-17]|uniref:hypothetical protein n=1 Tax=Maribacter sp. 2308TA10-17 TaxID=3386276 RepID=UPI0039BD1DD5
MIVVLLLTMIVIGLAFSVLRLIQNQMGSIGQNFENNTEVNLLQQALWVDFSTYPDITYNNVTNSMHCQNELGYVDYIFENGFIIREKDTFQLKLESKVFYLNGLENASGQLDALYLKGTKEQGAQEIFVYQKNAANEYMY